MLVYGGADTPAYVIDDETLREELLDEDEAAEYVAEVDDPLVVAYLRMLGRLDEAAALGEQVLAGCEPGSRAWGAAAVRLAQVHHWSGRYAEAHLLLDRAAAAFGQDVALGALVAQHRAKVLFDEGRLAEAAEQAGAALAARERLGDAGLVASSRQTVDRIGRER